jgi:hypothetical protein
MQQHPHKHKLQKSVLRRGLLLTSIQFVAFVVAALLWGLDSIGQDSLYTNTKASSQGPSATTSTTYSFNNHLTVVTKISVEFSVCSSLTGLVVIQMTSPTSPRSPSVCVHNTHGG